MQSKETIFEAVRRLAIAKGADVTKERIQIYAEYLDRYDSGEILKALEKLFRDCLRFPDVSEIIKIVDTPISDEDRANELAGAIVQAISDFGRYRSGEVQKKVGPIGWLTIERCGGWESLCNTRTNDLGTLRAQLRNTAKANMVTAKRLPSESLLPYQRESLERGRGLKLVDYSQMTD